MASPNLMLLYVADPLNSLPFYQNLFGQPPVTAFPTYVAFTFDNGLHLGLWSTSARDFHSAGSGHRSELAIMVDDDAEVDQLYAAWLALGVTIEQPLMNAVFGRTFVALDPDGHRLRVCPTDK